MTDFERDLFVGLAVTQGVYFLLTGLWPLFNIDTFQKVTGPKTDLWLVKTVGVLVAVMGAVLITGGLRQEEAFVEITVLGAGSAAGLATIDAVYVARRRISFVYLFDALAELVFLCGWGFLAVRQIQ